MDFQRDCSTGRGMSMSQPTLLHAKLLHGTWRPRKKQRICLYGLSNGAMHLRALIGFSGETEASPKITTTSLNIPRPGLQTGTSMHKRGCFWSTVVDLWARTRFRPHLLKI